MLEPMVAQGLSLRQIADALNRSGHRTRADGMYHANSVRRVLNRLELATQ